VRVREGKEKERIKRKGHFGGKENLKKMIRKGEKG